MSNLNVVIPMAGLGSRFRDAGYTLPKPFIDVNGKPMIENVIQNLYVPDATYILIMQKEHQIQHADIIADIASRYTIKTISVDKLTEGTACTVLYSRRLINNETPLLIANSDQIVDIDIQDFIADVSNRNLDGSILTFIDHARDPKWSFAQLEGDLVTRVKEKVSISEFATVGIYYFASGRKFVNAAIDMIIENDRVNNEFYTCPVYNYMIADNQKIGIFNIKLESMHGIGTPNDLTDYLNHISG